MIWYPYEQLKTMRPPYEIVDAHGVYLCTRDRELIDSVSSWWSVIHGYKHPQLNQAIHQQVEQFSHVMLGGLTHRPAQALADKLREFLPGDLNYSFFSDSGSVAVEVALKMALQFYMNRGETQRTMVLALEHAYHGDTFKTMEVGDDEDYHFVLHAYGPSPHVVHIPTEISALEQAFGQYHDRLNCLLVEPLLQGAGGMRMYDVSFLRRARELCDQYGVLLIFDEVATGFGRTGNRFVADLVLPIILLIICCVTGMLYSGGFFEGTGVVEAFSNSDASVGLLLGSAFALVFTFIYYGVRRSMTFGNMMSSIPEGFKAMVPAILILSFAWSLKAMTDSLGAKYFVRDFVYSNAESVQMFLPAIVFLIGCLLAFATGTSWGTFGMLIPIVQSVFPLDNPLSVVCISACMAGAVCGDHCSPISDTTIMASAGAQCDHVSHVSTQLPYAITVAVVSFVSYIIAGFVPNAAIALPIAIVLMVLTLAGLRMVSRKKGLA